ncbi:MAG TPA: DUF2958 domain-containing protein [Chloroflexota bacterium]|nr:DUF2958 domain-containing protein [Chloroflexota bacterium]
MRLLTKEIMRKLPALYATEDVPDGHRMALVKFFNPTSGGTWYVFEGVAQEDGDWLLFCYVVDLGFDELGYVSLRELEGVRLPSGLGIERDLHFRPVSLAALLAGQRP